MRAPLSVVGCGYSLGRPSQWLRQRANNDRLIYTVRQLRRPIFAAGGRVNPWTSGRGRSSLRSCAPHRSPRHFQAGSQGKLRRWGNTEEVG
jgi:hypothetical protein